MNEQGWWYVVRASGIVAWALLGLSVAAGVLLSGRRTRWRAPNWFIDAHRGLSGLGCAAAALHLGALLADSYTRFSVLDLAVPFRAAVKTPGLEWGVVAVYITALVQGTSVALHRLPHRWWRRIHYLGLTSFWLVTVHGVLAGTDTGNVGLRIAALVLVVGVAAATVARVPAGRGTMASVDEPGVDQQVAGTRSGE